MKKALGKIILTITAIIAVVVIIRTGKVMLAKAIYGEKVFNYIAEKSTEDHNIADCLLFSKDQTIWDIDRIIIDSTYANEGRFESGKADPYKEHFLTQLDRNNPDIRLYEIIKQAITEKLNEQGITSIHAIPVYSSAELWRSGQQKLWEENSPNTIHMSIYSYRSSETVNDPEVSLEFLFYRAKTHGRPAIHKTAPLRISLNEPEEESIAKVSKELQKSFYSTFPKQCIRYPMASNCNPAANNLRILLEKIF